MRKILYILTIIAFISCNTKTEKKKVIISNPNNYAKDIIFDVDIKIKNENDSWEKEKLEHTRNKDLVNDIFEALYNKKLTAYTYYDNSKLSIKEIKEIENQENYSREKISRIQFTEDWLFDKETGCFTKKINSIVLGYELYNNENKVKGYKALFKIKIDN